MDACLICRWLWEWLSHQLELLLQLAWPAYDTVCSIEHSSCIALVGYGLFLARCYAASFAEYLEFGCTSLFLAYGGNLWQGHGSKEWAGDMQNIDPRTLRRNSAHGTYTVEATQV